MTDVVDAVDDPLAHESDDCPVASSSLYATADAVLPPCAMLLNDV